MQQHVSLLGAADVGKGDARRPLPADRRGALLAFLAYDGGWVDRDRLAVLFWPDSDETSAKRNLRQLLHRTRRLDVGTHLEVSASALRWAVTTDVGDFRTSLGASDDTAAVEAYGGALLLGFTADDCSAFEAWLDGERAALQAAFHAAAMRVAEAATAAGRFDAAVTVLQRLRAGDPLAEDVVAATMRALYLGGRRDAAVNLFESFARELRVELDLEPLATTRELLERIRSDLPITGAPARPAGAAADRGSASGPEHRAALRPSRLFGRDDARSALLAATTPVVVVSGEAGLGKSALLAELYPDALRTGAREGLDRMPYHPFAALLRTGPDVSSLAPEHVEDLARLAPELAPGVVPAPIDPDTTRLRVAEGLARFVTAAARPLVIDDMQWADAATLECVAYLGSRGVRVIGAYRPAESTARLDATLAGLAARGELTSVHLGPVDERAVMAIMADLMHVDVGPELFSRRLWHRTGGNPLFVLETLRSLFEVGVLRTDDSGWHTDIDDITVDYAELDVPARVGEVIARRLDHLDEAARRVLEVVSLAPVSLSAAILARTTGLSLPATLAALDAADAAGFTDEGRFRHDLLREVTAASVSTGRARVTRGLLAEALAGEHGSTVDHGVLAELRLGAGENGEARREWLEQVAVMRTRGLHVAALEVLEDAIARLPRGIDRTWLMLARAEVTLEGGWHDRARPLLEAVEAVEPDESEVDPDLRARRALTRATWLFNGGSIKEADAALAGERHWFALATHDAVRLDLAMFDARIATQRGDLDAAIRLIEPVVARLRRQPPGSKLVQFITSLAAVHDQLGSHERALTLHREALSLARAMGSRYLAAEATINLLYCLSDLERYEEAIAIGEAALHETSFDNEPIVRLNLAANYRYAGRWAEAIEHYRVLASSELQHVRVIALARWSDAAVRLGDRAEALRLTHALLAAVPGTDYPVALGAAAIAVHTVGTPEQIAEFYRHAPHFDADLLPPFLRAELAAAAREHGSREPAADG